MVKTTLYDHQVKKGRGEWLPPVLITLFDSWRDILCPIDSMRLSDFRQRRRNSSLYELLSHVENIFPCVNFNLIKETLVHWSTGCASSCSWSSHLHVNLLFPQFKDSSLHVCFHRLSIQTTDFTLRKIKKSFSSVCTQLTLSFIIFGSLLLLSLFYVSWVVRRIWFNLRWH